ncbi:hypothetical protein [Prevotella sp. KH2C16]|uniref:hypothetical protein n=1 Tax=Prevotella sp. KH2C16 TaxID=1855325 RepID=UPI0008E676C1|nr:hypothetical protein [Prevotella sp. KH2C16]SFG08754.1 hypothetical protein SAMN05216383_1058 [Prevotella sp. KH2C16]
MILIADSGSTKTDWALIGEDNSVAYYKTKGINPLFLSFEDIRKEICSLQHELPVLRIPLPVYFYGAGCTADKAPQMARMLQEAFRFPVEWQEIHVDTDLMAAARALLGNARGIACILGTGSNSCLYDGEKIVMNTPPLGFILGDEGSGASLGKHFLNGIFKGWLPENMREEFLAEFKITYPQLIERVYRQPYPNRFLASIVPFISKNLEINSVKQMIIRDFTDFFRLNIQQYHQPELSIGFVGGVAYCFEPLLREVAQSEGFTVSTILKSPIEGLAKYHSSAL